MGIEKGIEKRKRKKRNKKENGSRAKNDRPMKLFHEEMERNEKRWGKSCTQGEIQAKRKKVGNEIKRKKIEGKKVIGLIVKIVVEFTQTYLEGYYMDC